MIVDNTYLCIVNVFDKIIWNFVKISFRFYRMLRYDMEERGREAMPTPVPPSVLDTTLKKIYNIIICDVVKSVEKIYAENT